MSDQYMLNFGGAALSFGGGSCGWEAPAQYPYLLFEFSEPSFGLSTTSLVSEHYQDRVAWSQVSTSPNVWKLEIYAFALPQEQSGVGLARLFGGVSENQSTLKPSNLGGGTCKLIGSGNLDMELNGVYCSSFDRTFLGASGLTYIEPIHCVHAINLGGMFQECVNVTEGALAQYNWFVANGVNVTNHSGTFTDCGRDTTTGAAELAQIPVGWGGNLVPASTLMTSSRTDDFGNHTTWKITGNAPDWTNIVGLYLFTEASVSTYAGVSMNRGRITKRNGLVTTQGSGALYFYPAFAQYTGSSQASRVITWVATTDTPNGSLTVSQGNTDMAGTLDYSTYGPVTRTYGTFDSNANVFFLFLVTNVPIANWTGLADAYGVLYNSNFKTDGGFRYFF